MAIRTEQEIREAIAHLKEAAKAEPMAAALMGPIIDVLRWVLCEPSRFQREVIDQCRGVDRARKAQDN